MSNTKMLIDATHPEETRVVVQRNGRVEEFDFESAARKLLRGNIYLAKVTRVEPSLQAAFVDYGGNRHGFLAFNEIHPDYYQIPVADRQALIDEEAAAEAELEAAADRRAEALARRAPGGRRQDQDSTPKDSGHDEPAEIDALPEASHIIDVEEDEHIEEVGGDASADDTSINVAASIAHAADTVSEDLGSSISDDHSGTDEFHHADPSGHHEAEDDEGDEPEDQQSDREDDAQSLDTADVPALLSSDEATTLEFHDEAPQRQRRRPRSYKIQEVIKRRQVILVQVVKEERGNKGAALTTYLSLAGRYTVLMPNTARGGGISRKITNPQDRKRLKAIANELEVPEGMGLIIRTAGAARTKQEIKRDFEYLLRLWESVRDLTLQSTAPSLVYEEGDLIKRSIRDLYNKDVEEVVVAGDAGFNEAAAFMHMLMPSHSKNVVPYKNPTPLFTSYGVERQLNAMFLPQVTLRSGGYIVINQTEALVAIDVNSGKSTREFSIEETALATNLEASDEIARQLKLRDLAGLIVIDFIDMEEKRNNRAVERRLKDALRFDRARIQLGRISHFGLMEMSRQRLRTGVLEGSTTQCPHCQGTGIIRSIESVALAVLRGLEDAITAGANSPLIATTTPAVALYILNSKRAYVTDMEARHGFSVTVVGSDRIQGANFTVERGAASAVPLRRPERAAVNMDWGFEGEAEEEAPSFQGAEIETVGDDEAEDAPASEHQGRDGGRENERGDGDDDGNRKGGRRRRRRGRGRNNERGDDSDRNSSRGNRSPDPRAVDAHEGHSADEAGADDAGNDDEDLPENDKPQTGEQQDSSAHGDDAKGDRQGRRRRRGRRGGRRGRDGNGAPRDANGRPDDNNDGSQSAQSTTNGDGSEGGNSEGTKVAPTPTQDVNRYAGRPERQRPDRIWDVPMGQAVVEPVANPTPVNHAQTVAQAPIKPVSQPEASATNAEAISTRRRHELDSSEPRIERVVVTPDQKMDSADEATATPQRKGWWQRRFGSE